jgi:hypothetical protein
MSKKIVDYTKRWFAQQRGEEISQDLIIHPHIQKWFDDREGRTMDSSQSEAVMRYVQRRIKEINDKES